MAITAKYPGHRYYCERPVAVGDLIEQANAPGRCYGHARCVPVAGMKKAARHEVRFSRPLHKDYVPQVKRYVNKGTALSDCRNQFFQSIYGKIEVREIESGEVIESYEGDAA
ncbi:MAG: hypothetical protein L0229_20340 [Blastocatellia bacterium]|nr:hypothetical protein [Blastocatellia bacterium]